MSLEAIDILENKIDSLVQKLRGIESENAGLRDEIKKKEHSVHDWDREKKDLEKEIDTLKSDSVSKQQRLDEAAQRIQTIVAKLESVL